MYNDLNRLSEKCTYNKFDGMIFSKIKLNVKAISKCCITETIKGVQLAPPFIIIIIIIKENNMMQLDLRETHNSGSTSIPRLPTK